MKKYIEVKVKIPVSELKDAIYDIPDEDLFDDDEPPKFFLVPYPRILIKLAIRFGIMVLILLLLAHLFSNNSINKRDCTLSSPKTYDVLEIPDVSGDKK